ncbi:DUF3307 domain-containing protein [Halomonas sp. BC04]|uniref:DUF3307 domain-containing protein n=1 Tax=Halomonas sp. BC04 TaxID=1403540 RepID=UPI0003ED8846|nr:DUF3307 domain-containing protein [Halomonas sp. BC04]EWH03821.1 hypothetical protein Q427_01150 [Halomonas sp. BC04]
MTSNDLSLLMGLVLAHLAGDFLLQPRLWVDERVRRLHRSRHLLYHVLVHAGLTAWCYWSRPGCCRAPPVRWECSLVPQRWPPATG